MTDQEFELYLADALSELETKQRYLEEEFGLGSHDQFALDYEKGSGELSFVNAGRVVTSFAITSVGSHVSEKNSWRWSWANSSLPQKVRDRAAVLQQLYQLTGFDVFMQEGASIDESMAWEFVALSCKIRGALGAYAMPQRQLRAYVLLDSVIRKA